MTGSGNILPIIKARDRATRDLELFTQFSTKFEVNGHDAKQKCIEHLESFITHATFLIEAHAVREQGSGQ
jgi:hypothetical protein